MRRKQIKGMRFLLTGAAMTGILAVAACEGENLFSVPGQSGGPAGADTKAPVVSITVPRGDSVSGVALEDSVFVSVHLTDQVGVRTVKFSGFSLRGDPNLGTQEVLTRFVEKTVELKAGVKDTTLSRYLASSGDTIRGTAYVVVEALDSAGNATADTASLWVGGPSVALPGLVDGTIISSGVDLEATITAADPKGVNRLTLSITGAVERDLVKTLGASALSTELDTAVAIPDTAAGPITVVATGRNTLGVVERSAPVQLFIADRKAPATTIILPRSDSLSARPLGDSVLVRVRVTDNFGVRSIRMLGIAERGDKDLGTDEVVTRFVERAITLPAGVKDTTISRYLRATADSTKEMAKIIVVAADSSGNQSSDTVGLVLGGPDVEILDILDGQSIQAGLALTARVRANDPVGIIQVRWVISGAFDTTIVRTISPPRDSIVVDTVITIPETAVGPMQITAVARNALDVSGQDGPLTMLVVATGAGDTISPVLKHSSSAPDRMEIQDSVTVVVTGTDHGGGVAMVGYTVLGISPTRGDTLIRSDSAVYDPPRTGTVTKIFKFSTFNVDSLSLPDTLIYEITTWMKDAQGNCAASVGVDSLVSLPCASLATGEIVAASRTGQRLTEIVVAGKTVRLPSGGRIMDAAVDTVRRRMFLSNIRTNRLDVFDIGTDRFLNSIGVGSEPWGLAINRAGDSLWVANSGGTNLSVVGLSGPLPLGENDRARLLTPDVGIHTVTLKVSESGAQWTNSDCPTVGGICSFSDRPQFVVVDSLRNLIYSTKTTQAGEGGTPAGERGTARKGYYTSGMDRPEVKIFADYARKVEAEDTWTIFHVDGVTDDAGFLVLQDHVSGFPSLPPIKGVVDPNDPAGWPEGVRDAMRDAGSDVVIRGGAVNYEDFMYRDTTYVAASGDGGWVVVGEGAAAPFGRVLTYRAAPGDSIPVTSMRQTIDLITNAAEQVRGVGLNHDGSAGVIRGRFAAYFISPEDLRLQGVVSIPSAELGSGAALHPLHANARSLENLGGDYFPDTHLAFVASGERTIEIIDTWRFTRIGRVYLRDIVTGPLRAVLPFAEDNAGLTCGTVPVTNRVGTPIGNAVQLYAGGSFGSPLSQSDAITEDRCVVMKLFATTSAGGVVVVDVRKADIFREHPNRN